MRPQHITAENAAEIVNRFSTTCCFNEAAAYHCGKLWSGISTHAGSGRFNEAAAYHCGKPQSRLPAGPHVLAASMRPQHITAENGCGECVARHSPAGFNEAAAYHCGKPEIPSRVMAGPWSASMRPQHITAENAGSSAATPRRAAASMRPQHITAENRRHVVNRDAGVLRFNEAAAYHCGKPPAQRRGEQRWDGASMRPQHITAENLLQEVLIHMSYAASMRPQHITAENSKGIAWTSDMEKASMRPQHITAENKSRRSSSACDGPPLQ